MSKNKCGICEKNPAKNNKKTDGTLCPACNNEFLLVKSIDFTRRNSYYCSEQRLKEILANGDLSDEEVKWLDIATWTADSGGSFRSFIYRLLEEVLRNREQQKQMIESSSVEPEEPECCNECGFTPKIGNIVYLDNGRRPLCTQCNPDNYTWICGSCKFRLPKLLPKPAKCWHCLTGITSADYLNGIAKGERCEQCGFKPKKGNFVFHIDGPKTLCTRCNFDTTKG